MAVSLLPCGPGAGAAPPANGFRIEALFGSRAAAEAAAGALGGAACCSRETLPDRDWVAEGRRGFAPQRFGRSLWVVPEWCEPPDPQAANVIINPGLAFGTGGHPSTALCLEWLAGADIAGRCVVDYGCGSGILAVAAARLGAARVSAVDVDPQARAAARTCAERNAVEISVAAPEALARCTADVLVANILARPLMSLAAEFCRRVRPGGRIVLAGITAEQADAVAAAYLPGAQATGRSGRGQWVCLELLRGGVRPD